MHHRLSLPLCFLWFTSGFAQEANARFSVEIPEPHECYSRDEFFAEGPGLYPQFFLDIYLEADAKRLYSIEFCISLPQQIRSKGFLPADLLVRSRWTEPLCFYQAGGAPGGGHGVTMFRAVGCPARSPWVPIQTGRLYLGRVGLVIVADEEIKQEASLTVGSAKACVGSQPSIGCFTDDSDRACDVIQPATIEIQVQRRKFIRGDSNLDAQVNIADPVFVLTGLFRRGGIECANAADANDDNQIDVSDAIYLLQFLFLRGLPPPPPYPEPGYDRNATAPEHTGCRGL
jgi:hypothetical protein